VSAKGVHCLKRLCSGVEKRLNGSAGFEAIGIRIGG
jgi:hypothetical protein